MGSELFWFSLCPKLLGENEKLCICEFCGSSLLAPGSPTIVCRTFYELSPNSNSGPGDAQRTVSSTPRKGLLRLRLDEGLNKLQTVADGRC